MLRGLTVLTYHRVLPCERCANYPLSSLVVSESLFAQQVAWLADCCHVMTLEQALSLNRVPGDRPVVCICFDDGYDDNFVAAKILNRRGQKATFFVTTDLVDGRPMWYDIASVAWVQLGRTGVASLAGLRLSERVGCMRSWMSFLKQMDHHRRIDLVALLGDAVDLSDGYRGMTKADVRQLVEWGHEIGCHTISHPRLEQLDDTALQIEIVQAKAKVESICGRTVAGFCYPDGSLSERIAAIVQHAGYRYACTTELGINTSGTNRYRLKRFDVTRARTTCDDRNHDPLLFEAEISGLHKLIGR